MKSIQQQRTIKRLDHFGISKRVRETLNRDLDFDLWRKMDIPFCPNIGYAIKDEIKNLP
jgi:hypothetical protein